jgi:uncharacterized protein (DUF1501 family)
MSDPCDKTLTRRQFLSLSGLGLMGVGGALPRWAAAAAAQAAGGRRRSTLVVLFQRGAADGLSIVPPFNDAVYRKARPSLAAALPGREDGALDLDGRFGLHPRLKDLLPLWKDGRFAVVQAAGSPDGTRSHFDAQDYMESGTPGVKTTEDGWLNRALTARGGRRGPVDAVAVAPRLPLTLRGAFPALAAQSVDQLTQAGALEGSFEAMYDQTVDALLSGAVHDISEARKALSGIPRFDQAAYDRLGYPKGRLSRDLHEVARLIKADAGLRVAFVEAGGWDHHQAEQNRMARGLDELGGAIAAFYREIDSRSESVLLVTMTEFGRTLEENGNGGTDHGHASVMMLFGGRVRGGRVHGAWPGLAPEQLFEQRDLAVTTDYRQVLSEVLARHCGVTRLDAVFPGGQFPALGLLG